MQRESDTGVQNLLPDFTATPGPLVYLAIGLERILVAMNANPSASKVVGRATTCRSSLDPMYFKSR